MYMYMYKYKYKYKYMCMCKCMCMCNEILLFQRPVPKGKKKCGMTK